MTPELIAILAVGATIIGLLLTFRRDARADSQRQRAEARADMASFRTEMRADMQDLRSEVRGGRGCSSQRCPSADRAPVPPRRRDRGLLRWTRHP